LRKRGRVKVLGVLYRLVNSCYWPIPLFLIKAPAPWPTIGARHFDMLQR